MTTYLIKRTNTVTNEVRFEMQDVAAKTNMSKEARAEGWLGTTNDWEGYALGEFATSEAAIAHARADDANAPIFAGEWDEMFRTVEFGDEPVA